MPEYPSNHGKRLTIECISDGKMTTHLCSLKTMNQFKEKALSKLPTSRNPNSSLFTEFRQLMIRPLCKTITV